MDRRVHAQAARTTFIALDLLAARYREAGTATSPGRPLRHAELSVFSENGEDGVIQAMLERIGEGSRTFVEIGTGDGRQCNCAFLASVLDWSGIFIEADAADCALLADRYADAPGVAVINARVSPETVNGLLANAPPEPDVLSIDIDGDDYWVWEAITCIAPTVAVIEYNAALPRASRLVQPRHHGPWDGTDGFGASLGALEMLGRSTGYVLVHTDLAGVNAFFVRERDAHLFPEAAAPARRAPNFVLAGGRHPPGHQRVRADTSTAEETRHG